MEKKLSAALLPVIIICHLIFFSINFYPKKNLIPKKPIVVNTLISKQNNINKIRPPKTEKNRSLSKDKLLNELKKSLSNIENNRKDNEKIYTPLTVPKNIHTLEVNNLDTKNNDSNYFNLLAAKLKKSLELPDKGKVKLDLTISNLGKVLKVNARYSESEKNKLYLIKHLMQLQFEPFLGKLKKENEYTFQLTFSNET